MFLLGLAMAAAPQAVQVWVEAPTAEDRAELAALGADFAEGSRGSRVLVQMRPSDLERLPARFAPEQVLHRGALAEHYHDPEELLEALEALAEHEGVELVEVGRSVEDRPLWALRMGNPEGARWRVLGAHHGDEASSSELALELARALLTEPDWQPLLEDRELWVLPVVNPDGLVASSRNNANGVDLNRNYSFEWRDTVFSGEAPFTEPEVQAVRRMSVYAPPMVGLSLHSGAENIGYPWNYSKDATPEEPELLALGELYGAACEQPDFYVTNGADWYVTYGDTNDWSLAEQGSWDFTLELSDTKAPAEGELEEVLAWHLPAIRALLEEQPRASGRVMDAQTGRPVEARLSLDRSSSTWLSDPVTGLWHRPLETGLYTLSVEAPGYAPQELELRVHASELGELEVLLQPESLRLEALETPLISKSEAEVWLDLPGPTLKLSRPGFDPLEVERSDDGFLIPTAALAAGPWTVTSEDWTRVRGLLVSDPEDGVVLRSVSVDEHIELQGQGFGRGSRAWLLHGPDRALEPVEVLEESGERLLLELPSPPADGTADLLVLSKGSEVAVVDLFGELALDTSMPEPDSADTALPSAGAPVELVGYRGCQTTPPPGSWMLALALAAPAVVRRRKRCR